MMRYVLIVILGLAFSSVASGTESADQLTLAKSIKMAMENNRQILQGKQMMAGAEAKVNESASYKYPQLQLGASYTRLGLVPEYMGFKLAAADNYSYKATASQVLWAWGKISNGVSLSRTGLDMAKQGVTLTEREITFAVVQIFYQLLATQEAIKVMDDNINLLEQRLEMMKQKYEAGEASDFDILSTEVQISSAQGGRLDTLNGLGKLKLQFNLIIGRPVAAPVDIAGALSYSPAETDEQSSINDALANRVEIRQIQSKERMAQLQKELAQTANRPDLNSFASWELKNGYQPDLDQHKGAWTFGVMMSFPLFDGFRNKAQIRQAEANLSGIRLEYEQQRQSVEAEVRQALLDIQSAWQKIELCQLTITQAEKALKIAEERYQNGLIDTLDLLSSQSSLSNARLNLLQSAYNFNLSRYNLEKAVGKEFTVKE